MDDRRHRLDRDQRGSQRRTDDHSRPRSASASPEMSDRPCRPWQRPPQFQHGHHDNAFGDAETTGALLARLAAARDREGRSASPAGQSPASGTTVDVPVLATELHDAAEVYLGLLDRILEDRVITDAEGGRLQEVATVWGIGILEAASLHRGYIARAWARACADGTVTPAEFRDIETLADLLGVPVELRRHDARVGTGARRVAVTIEAGTTAVGPGPRSAPRVAAHGGRLGLAVRPSGTNERR